MSDINNVNQREQFLYNIGLDLDLIFGEYTFDFSLTNSDKYIILYYTNKKGLSNKLRDLFEKEWNISKFYKSSEIKLPEYHEYQYQYYFHFKI